MNHSSVEASLSADSSREIPSRLFTPKQSQGHDLKQRIKKLSSTHAFLSAARETGLPANTLAQTSNVESRNVQQTGMLQGSLQTHV